MRALAPRELRQRLDPFGPRAGRLQGNLRPVAVAYRLGQLIAGLCLNQTYVRGIDHAINVHVVTEIRADSSLARVRFCLTNIRSVDGATSRRVSQENAHRDDNISGIRSVAYPYQGDRNRLRVRDTGQIHRYLISAGAGAGRPGSR